VISEILRWGLLSTAAINEALIPALRASARNHLVAVASREQARAQAYAAKWDIPRAFGSYQAMLADGEIDVVYISLPNSLHAAWTIAAAQAGKHVLCEKPLALSVEEVDAVAAASQRAGVVVAEAFMYRHHRQTLKAIELIASGAIGTVRLARGGFSFFQSRPADPRLDPALGGGSIWDVGCYPISYIRAALGMEPREVFGWQMVGPEGVDMIFAGQMRFDNEVCAQFDCGFRAADRQYMEFTGDRGTLTVQTPFTPEQASSILLAVKGGTHETIGSPGGYLYLGEVEDMADAILLGKAPRISLADSRGNVAAITALLQSAREGRPVRITP
jgi:xylose dehydrogenase (NAD/NADP)